jgi:transposase
LQSADPHQRNQEETDTDATTVGVDLAKTVFELAIADVQSRITVRQRLNRTQFARFLRLTGPTHVVMKACGMAALLGRVAQGHGQTVTLVRSSYVRPYVRRNKTAGQMPKRSSSPCGLGRFGGGR